MGGGSPPLQCRGVAQSGRAFERNLVMTHLVVVLIKPRNMIRMASLTFEKSKVQILAP